MVVRFLDAGSVLSAIVFSAALILQGSFAAADESSSADGQSPVKKTVGFEDDFDRNDLGARYEILKFDPNRLVLSSGKLVVVGTSPINNRILLNKHLGSDFVATVELRMALSENNSVALSYFIDDQNRLALGVAGTRKCDTLPWDIDSHGNCWGERRQPFFTKILEGHFNNILGPTKTLGRRNLDGYPKNPETWYFQLRREGVRYTGLISVDGVRWIKIGSHVIVSKNGLIGLSVASGGGIETAAEFDNLVIQE